MSTQSATTKLLSALSGQIEAHHLRGGSLIIAVSGGPDSLALVHALRRLRDCLGLDLRAAHLDHGLRAESSAADADFVRRSMDSLQVPLTVDRVDVIAFHDRHRMSIEDSARRLRYGFLARVASENDSDTVALGHTLDDQAETVLMRILRGSGLDGLRAMSVISDMDVDGVPLTLFRPMLDLRKADTLAYCSENGLTPRLDETNLSTDPTRNRIRLDLMPLLEEYNPSVSRALARLAESASLDVSLIEQQVDRAVADLMEVHESGVSLDRLRFARMHPALQRRVLRHAVRAASGSSTDLTYAHVVGILELMTGPSGSGMDLPGGLRFMVDHDRAHLRLASVDDCPLPMLDSVPFHIAVPGKTSAGKWKIVARLLRSDGPHAAALNQSGLRLRERFNAESVGSTLRVRRRKPGDTFQPLGMDAHRKLKDFMIDAHIPRRWRDSIPLVEAGSRIAWVVGWRIADWAKVTHSTQTALEISFELD